MNQAQITILVPHEQETDAKNRTSTNLASELTNPFEMAKKTSQTFESLNSDVRAMIQAQITISIPHEQQKDKKNRTSTNSASELTNPLKKVKKTIQVFELLNSDVRTRIQAQITILVPHEQETDAKNRTSTNLAFELTNP